MTNPMSLYEQAFDLNDYVLLAMILIGFGLICIVPKRFSRSVTCLILLYCSTVACMLDNSLGGHIFDMYDIMDGPKYSIMDFMVYFMYPPPGYFFVYFYDRWQFKGMQTLFYITACSLLAVLVEWGCVKADIFHYHNGYFIWYSFCIYITSQTATIFFYRFITNKPGKTT